LLWTVWSGDVVCAGSGFDGGSGFGGGLLNFREIRRFGDGFGVGFGRGMLSVGCVTLGWDCCCEIWGIDDMRRCVGGR
jgi:hypothetical protein